MDPRRPSREAARLPLASRFSPPGLFIRAVYWSTPLFVALDFVYGISLRIPFLDALPGAKPFYYALELACGVAVAARPRWTAAIGFGESVVNISLLVLTTGAAYIGVLESAASPDVVIANPFTPQAVASLALTAGTLAASYVLNARPQSAVDSRPDVSRSTEPRRATPPDPPAPSARRKTGGRRCAGPRA